MLISESKKFIFYHVYKVAGSSIRATLRPYCSKWQIYLQNLFHGFAVLKIALTN